jgi:hypothetical protein
VQTQRSVDDRLYSTSQPARQETGERVFVRGIGKGVLVGGYW